MIDFYNAFISYKHAPLDMKIASHVQKQLEHFHVPHKLKGKIRHKKITRIFRDKDELPITSDLTETITNALENSEYLIVICSTNTKESMWVKREIQTFLKTHTKDKIYTVLCDGEPQDVIPEELVTMEKEIVDASGFTHTVKVPVEPLSCDYRMPMSRADKEELPRLAAGLLGCSYDELQRRARQYRLRRAAAILAVAFAGVLAFGGYMLYSRTQINNAYMESLRSRSTYLAHESEQLLKDNKRVDAVHLALAALPQDKNDKMPVTAPAIRSIIKTTLAYKSSQGMGYEPVWNFKTDHPISTTIMSNNQKHLAALDSLGNAYCWDMDTRELIFKKDVENIPIRMVFVDDDTLLLTYKDRLEAYNVQTQKSIWTFKDETIDDLYSTSVVVAANFAFASIGDGKIVKLSGRDGAVKNTFEVNKGSLTKSIFNLAVSPDGKKLAFCDASYIFDDSMIHVLDTVTGQEYVGAVDGKSVEYMSFTADGKLCILLNDEIASVNAVDYGNFRYLDTGKLKLNCYDSQMIKLWSTEFEFNAVPVGKSIMELPAREAVMAYTGNTAIICDLKTGKLLNTLKPSSSIVSACDINSNGMPEFICEQGEYVFQLYKDKGALATIDFHCKEITTAFYTGSIYAVAFGSNDIICYDQYLVDDEFQQIKAPNGYIAGTTYQVSAANDNYLVIASKLTDIKTVRISIVDLKSGKLASTKDIEYTDDYLTNLELKYINESFYAFIGSGLYEIDPEDGDITKKKIEIDPLMKIDDGLVIKYKTDSVKEELTLEITDIIKNKTKSISYSGIKISSMDTLYPVYVRNINKIFVAVDEEVFVADPNKSKLEKIDVPDSWNGANSSQKFATASDDGSKIILTDGNTVVVMDDSYKILYTFRCDCKLRCGAFFHDGKLYFATDNYLGVFNADTGESIARYEINDKAYGKVSFSFRDKDQQLFIQTVDQIIIFDTETWTEIAVVENAYCYNEASDRFYTYTFMTSDEVRVGYFRRYTLEDLIEKAKTYLGNHELDESTKAKYGL